MHTFSQFSASGITLFKPKKAHRLRSSFYLVARGVQPGHEAAREAVKGWKAKWKMATFGVEGEGGVGVIEGEEEVLGSAAEEKVRGVLGEFGGELVRLVEPVFEIQAEGLREAPWVKEGGGKGEAKGRRKKETEGEEEGKGDEKGEGDDEGVAGLEVTDV